MMAWVKKSGGANNEYMIATETIALGTGTAQRYTSVIDFIPAGVDFMIVSNTAATNLSGSASDQLYGGYESAGIFYQMKNTLRDCNYTDDTNQGTSFRNIDNTARLRHVNPEYVGEMPYYKLAVLNAAAESSSKTVSFAIIVGGKKRSAISQV
jgi:hypothetical protein